MERGEKRFKSEKLDAFAAIYNDSTTLYLDLQDTSLSLQKSGYSTNPVREQRLLIAALQYATVSDNAHLSIMEKLTDSIAQEEKNVYDRAEKLRDIIVAQRQRPIKIDREISSIRPPISNKTAVSEEFNNFRHRFNALTEESSSRSKLIQNLLLWAF